VIAQVPAFWLGVPAVTLTGMLQTDAAISSGNSCGPLADASAHVGINTMTATSAGTNTAQNIGLAIASHTVQSLLPRLRKGGALTGAVAPDSPAAHAGLQPDDVIVGLAGAPIRAGADLIAVTPLGGPPGRRGGPVAP
jgi:putative serine protease PepD